jgi:hypothetical protein
MKNSNKLKFTFVVAESITGTCINNEDIRLTTTQKKKNKLKTDLWSGEKISSWQNVLAGSACREDETYGALSKILASQ